MVQFEDSQLPSGLSTASEPGSHHDTEAYNPVIDFCDPSRVRLGITGPNIGDTVFETDTEISFSDGIEADFGDAPSSRELFGLHEKSTFVERLLILLAQASPIVVSFFLSNCGTFINLLFASRFVPTNSEITSSSALLAGVNLANLFANVSCLSLQIGMSSAVETLGSQKNGAGEYREVGLVLQRSCAILATISAPMLLLWVFSYDIFRSLGVEHDVCSVIAGYLHIRALAVPVELINVSYEKYLMSIGVVRPTMWAAISFNVALVIFNLIFILGLHRGYEYLAVSWALSDLVLFAVQISMSCKHPFVERTLQPLDWAAWAEWKPFFALGLPGTVMLCSEWWAFEFLTIFATLLGTEEVAAQTVIMQIATLSFMIPLGLGVATASVIGNCIGARKQDLAIKMGKLSLECTLVVELLLAVIIITVGPHFIHLFSEDEKVRAVAESAIPILAMFTTIDGFQGVGSGVLRGAGKQLIGAIANVIAFYALGLPIAWILCFNAGFGVGWPDYGDHFCLCFSGDSPRHFDLRV